MIKHAGNLLMLTMLFLSSFFSTSIILANPRNEYDLGENIISEMDAREVTTNSAIIHWATSQLSTGFVEYGLTDDYGLSTEKNENLTLIHDEKLSDLSAVSKYHYRVHSNEIISYDHHFNTLNDEK